MLFDRWRDEDRANPLCDDDRNVSLFGWLGVYALMLMPVINIVILIYWSIHTKKIPVSQANWARATLIFLTCLAISVGLFVGFCLFAESMG